MPIAPMSLIEYCFEYARAEDVNKVPSNTRGIYVLYKQVSGRGKTHFDVVYVGIASASDAGIRGRLVKHRQSKAAEWTHFSVFAVWPNISADEVKQLEGLLRHIYRHDSHANRLNIARTFAPLTKIRKASASAQPPFMKGVRSDRPRKAKSG